MLSIILLSYQSEKRIDKFFGALNKKMVEENIEFECIIMDDASTDESHTVALEIEKKYKGDKIKEHFCFQGCQFDNTTATITQVQSTVKEQKRLTADLDIWHKQTFHRKKYTRNYI